MDLAYDQLGTVSEATLAPKTEMEQKVKVSKPQSTSTSIVESPGSILQEPVPAATPDSTPLNDSESNPADLPVDELQQSEKAAAKVEEKFSQAADTLENSVNDVYARMSNAATAVTTAASATSWGSALGGFWSKVKQQSEATYKVAVDVAVHEIKETKLELEGLKSELDEFMKTTAASKSSTQTEKRENKDEKDSHENEDLSRSVETLKDKLDSDSKETGNAQSMLSMLTVRAQKYIDDLDKDLEQFENEAGKKLFQMGTNLQGMLKSAVNVVGPDAGADTGLAAEVLFNVPEDVQNQIYSTRLDAQLHALHTTREPFLAKDESDPGYVNFAKSFSVERHTETIARDLDLYPQLRALMESLVPDSVTYNNFWTKYYFMRSEIADQEEKRKQLLSQAQTGSLDEEEVDWDDDDDEEDQEKVNVEQSNHSSSATISSFSIDVSKSLVQLRDIDTSSSLPPSIISSANPVTPTTSLASNVTVPSSAEVHPSSRPSSEFSYDLVSKSSSVEHLAAPSDAASVLHPSSGVQTTTPKSLLHSRSTEETVLVSETSSRSTAENVRVPIVSGEVEDSESEDDWE